MTKIIQKMRKETKILAAINICKEHVIVTIKIMQNPFTALITITKM